MTEIAVLTNIVSALQATFEAVNIAAGDLPAEQRARLDAELRRIQQAKAALMFEIEERR